MPPLGAKKAKVSLVPEQVLRALAAGWGRGRGGHLPARTAGE